MVSIGTSGAADGVLFVPYRDTLDLLGIDDAMLVCEEVYRMHARGSVQWSDPPALKLDVGEPWHNHWHVEAVFLKDIPATGMRMYNYYDDGVRNTVGRSADIGVGGTTSTDIAIAHSARAFSKGE